MDGNDLGLVGLNSTLMEHGRELALLQGVEVSFGTPTKDGSKVTPRRLDCVMLFMLNYGGVYMGLYMAWREDITHLIVESDSKVFVDVITDNRKFSGTILTLVQRIQKFLNFSWTVQVNRTLREGNISANWLANISILMDSMNFIF